MAAKHLALLSVSDKTGLLDLARGLNELGIKLVGSGGTAKAIRAAGIDIEDVSTLTSSPEILGGRVKTLHPTVHGAILARLDLDSDVKDLQAQKIQPISIVVCNLYPFEATVAKTPTPPIAEAIEEIDIGGVTLLRAAAKNHARVSVLTAPSSYASFLDSLKAASGDPTALTATLREQLALSAFSHTAAYDSAISSHLRRTFASADNVNAADPAIRNEVRERAQQLTLRYGANPHQIPAQAFVSKGSLPFKVLCGSPGYINLLDALSSFSLVRELSLAFEPALPAAASFKHVSPAGAAVAHPSNPLTQEEIQVFGVDGIAGIENSPLAQAYARARGADRMSSFGDFIALSHTVDTATAKIIGREVSDGVIAPGYEPEALEILRKKKGGKYCVLQMDPLFKPDLVESRQVQGVTLEQRRNDALITAEVFANVVSSNKDLPDAGLTDLTVATLALKYTQSNSVGFAYRGGIIGLGAGQQSRIHCTRLAGDKADAWWLRHHPRVLSLEFKKGVTRPTKANAIDALVTGQIWETEEGSDERKEWEDVFEAGKVPHEFSRQEKRDWMKKLRENGGGVACASDAFFPFADNVERAARSGVAYIAAPGGSVMDEKVVKTADDKGIVYAFSKYRLFTH